MPCPYPKYCRDTALPYPHYFSIDRTCDLKSGATGIDLIWWVDTDISIELD